MKKIIFIILLFPFVCITKAQQLINHNGKSYFLCGSNIAWNNYGWDFGVNTKGWGGGNGYNATWWENTLSDLQNYGGNSIRVWIHCKGELNPLFDGNGTCTGLNTNLLTDLDDMISKAEKHNIMVLLCLFDFKIVDIGRQDIIKDINKSNAYINNALIPMVKHLTGHCNLLGYEIINEPEWILGGLTGGGTFSKDVTILQMQKFVGMCAEAIHNNCSQKVTVGSASLRWNSDVKPADINLWKNSALNTAYNSSKAYLDFYQIHYYDWMLNNGNDWAPYNHSTTFWELDKPTLIGETGNTGHYNYQQQYDLSYSNGFAGTLPWAQSVSCGGATTWGQFNNQLKIFRDNNISQVDFFCNNSAINDENEIENKLVLFPNPTSGVVTITNQFNTDVDIQIQVMDMIGQTILNSNNINSNGAFIKDIDLSNFPSGIYLLHMKVNDKIVMKKIIKE